MILELDSHGFPKTSGIFETIKTVNGQPIALARHMRRALDSARSLGLKMPPEEEEPRSAVRTHAKKLTAKRQANYIEGRLGLIIDGTGREITKIARAKEKLLNMGYSCMMLFVNTSLEIAQKRNIDRPGRTIKPEEVEKMWRAVQDNMMKFQQLFGADKFQVIDNSGSLEDPDRAENFKVVAKNIDAFVNRPPRNRYAKAWIEDQKKKKNITNQQE